MKERASLGTHVWACESLCGRTCVVWATARSVQKCGIVGLKISDQSVPGVVNRAGLTGRSEGAGGR